MDSPILPLVYLVAFAASAVLYAKRRTVLRASVVLLFLLGFLGPLLFSWLIESANIYDHGTAREFLPTAAFSILWALALVACSILQVRREPSLSIVFPILFITAALLYLMFAVSEFQHRFDFYDDFYFFHQANEAPAPK